MQELSNAQRHYLRRMAHDLRPLVQIGRQGLTDQALASIDRTLDAHELIKIKFLDFQDEKHALSDTIAERLDTVLIGIVGNVATFYRQQRDPDKRKITLPAPSHD